MLRPSSTKKVRSSGTRGVNSIGGRNVLPSGRSSSLSRVSGASQGRFSEGGRTQSKDPRPVTEKSFLNGCAQKILKFCSDNEYKSTHLSLRALMNPSLKDFFGIFEFLCSMLKGSFKYSLKPEDEIPKMVKLLRYPFSINRSMLLGLGSRQTWGCLLGLLVWMIDLVELSYETNVKIYINGEEEFSGEFNELVLDGVTESYRRYMETGETDDTRDADLFQKFVQTCKKQCNLDQLQDCHQRLAEQQEELTKKLDDNLEQERTLERTAQDIERLEQYLVQMDTYLAGIKEKCNANALQIKSIEDEIGPLRLERDRLKVIINQQTAEANQYKLAVAKRDAAKERYETACAMVSRLENAVTDREVKCCNAWNIIQKLIREHEDINSNTKTIVKLYGDELASVISSQLVRMTSESHTSDFIKDIHQILVQTKDFLLTLQDKEMETSNSVMNAEGSLKEHLEYYKEIELEENNIQASLDAEKLKDARSEAEFEEEFHKIEQILRETDEKQKTKQYEVTRNLAIQKKKVQALEAKLAEWVQKIPEYEKEYSLVLKKTSERINAYCEERAKIETECVISARRELEKLMT